MMSKLYVLTFAYMKIPQQFHTRIEHEVIISFYHFNAVMVEIFYERAYLLSLLMG